MGSRARLPRELDRITVELSVRIRPAVEEDLEALEWFGAFRRHRGLARETFRRQREGSAVILVLEANGAPSGQAWIDLKHTEDVGMNWAVRLLPCLQNLGLGSRLAGAAERVLQEHGLACAEVSVDRDNPGGLRFWRRLGYEPVGERPHNGRLGPGARAGLDRWVLRKLLVAHVGGD